MWHNEVHRREHNWRGWGRTGAMRDAVSDVLKSEPFFVTRPCRCWLLHLSVALHSALYYTPALVARTHFQLYRHQRCRCRCRWLVVQHVVVATISSWASIYAFTSAQSWHWRSRHPATATIYSVLRRFFRRWAVLVARSTLWQAKGLNTNTACLPYYSQYSSLLRLSRLTHEHYHLLHRTKMRWQNN